MSKHSAKVIWRQSTGDFLAGTYSRVHSWRFDGGIEVPASPALSSVKSPYSSAACVDPEEAFVAAISSCHMLTFLYVASRAGIEVLSYEDEATGTMTPNDRGVDWMSLVELHPKITYGRNAPPPEVEQQMHHDAHEECYISNSVKTEIRILPA